MDQTENTTSDDSQELPVVDTENLNQDLPADYADQKIAQEQAEEAGDGEV